MMIFMERVISRMGAALFCGVALLMSPAKAGADFLYLFGDTWAGASPAKPGPWVSELFQDIAPGTISLTISNSGLSGTEYLQKLYLNLNPKLDPTKLRFNEVGATAGLTLPTIQTGINSFQADGDGKYDVVLSFSTANKGRFAANDYLTYRITGISGLTTSDFEGFLSTRSGCSGPFLGGVQIVSIGACGASGWADACKVTPVIPVPEPSGGLFFALGAGVWMGMRRLCGRR
jgi:hypothetical protein